VRRYAALLLLAAACADPQPDPPREVADRDRAPAEAVPAPVSSGRDAEAPVTGSYADTLRGFALDLPAGVALIPFEDSTRLHLEKRGRPFVVIRVVDAAPGRTAHGMVHEIARHGCIVDDHDVSAHCPDTLDYESRELEMLAAPGVPMVRFDKEWVLTDAAGAEERREIGPYWLIEIVEGPGGRALLVHRPEPGRFTDEEIREVEALLATYREISAG